MDGGKKVQRGDHCSKANNSEQKPLCYQTSVTASDIYVYIIIGKNPKIITPM